MANIQVFEYQNNKVRTVDVEGEAWFVLKDVCEILRMDTTQLKKVADRLDEDEKGRTLITTPGGMQETWIVNESGLYHVILRSDKPEAAPFRRWVTNDVLPEIRKTGSYNAPQLTRSQLLATALIAAHEELEEKDKRIAELTPDAEFARAVCIADNCRTATSIAKDYGLTAEKLNKLLYSQRVQYKDSDGQWVLYKPYQGKGYTKNRKGKAIQRSNGKTYIPNTTVWTVEGESSSMSNSRSLASRRESRSGLLQNSKISEDGRTEHGEDYHLEGRP